MSNLTVRYYINLVSDIAKKSADNARALEQANKRQTTALKQTDAAATRTAAAIGTIGQKTSLSKLEGDARRGISAVDNITAATRRADQAMSRLGAGSSSFERMNRYMTGIAQRMDTVRQKAAQVTTALKGMDSVATGVVAGGAAAAALLKRPMDFDNMLADMANTVFADRDAKGRIAGIAELQGVIKHAVDEGGGSRDTAAQALNEMVASGVVSPQDAMKMLPELQKAATASGADVTELTNISIRAMQNFGLTAEEIPVALSKAMKAGQEGGFELRDMARWLPSMMAVSKGMLGMSGMAAFEKLITMSQASVITAGSKDEAGNNMVRFMAKINSKDTAMDFEKLGINLPKSLAKAMEDGVPAPDAFVNFVEQIAMKDKQFAKLKAAADAETDNKKRAAKLDAMAGILQGSAIGQVIQDKQVLMALIGVMQNKDYLKRVGDEVSGETGKTAETNFEVKKSRAAFKTQQASNEVDFAVSNVFKEVDGPLQSLLSGATGLAREFPALTTAVTGAAGAFAIFKAASMGSGLMNLLRGGSLAGAAAGVGGVSAPTTVATAAPRLNALMLPETPAPAAPAATTGLAARAGGILRKLGWLGVGLTAVDVGATLMDDNKTAEQKVLKVGEAGGGLAGGWAGAKAGAALGTLVGGPIGTLLGGLAGGGLGWWAGSKLVGNSLMQPPTAETVSSLPPQKTEVEIKQGRMVVDIRLNEEYLNATASVLQHFDHINIDAGSTNPGGY